MFMISTGIEVILARIANNPMSTNVATPEDAANLVFIRINFLTTSFLNNAKIFYLVAKLMLIHSKPFFHRKILNALVEKS